MVEKPIRVLHLEDNPNDAELVRRTLKAEGLTCTIDLVSTEPEFAAALALGSLELILSDYSLPMFDGLAALSMASAQCPDVPFLLVSGTIGEDAAIESLRNGATDYVLKLKLSRLGPAVRRALREAEERRQRRQATEALHNKQQFLMAMLESLDTGIVACDAVGDLTLVNRAMREIHGPPPCAFPAERWAKWFGFYDQEGEAPLAMEDLPLYRAFQGEIVHNTELQIRRHGATPRTALVNGRPVVDIDGRRIGAVVAVHDLTEKNALEAQLRSAQRMETIGRLAAGVAHDFNNLLSVILSYGEMVRREVENNPALARKVDQIRKATERAASLTRQLLTVSRQPAPSSQVLDLRDVIAEIEKILQRLVGEDVELVLRSPETACLVRVDPGQVEQVVMNLAVNARDAMPRGGRLTIEMSHVQADTDLSARHPSATSSDYIQLSVADTGTGIPEEARAQIFEPFFTTKGPGVGTGLGLSIVYGIVKQHKGVIEVDGKPGEGAVFRIYLPRVEHSGAAPGQSKVAASPYGSETILVVEDDPETREVLRAGLAQYGYSVVAAADGVEAERLAEHHRGRLGLLLCEVVLPRPSGRPLAERLRAQDARMKVLFTSVYPQEVITRHGFLAHGEAFVQKPLALTTMARKIREVLGQPSAEVASAVGPHGG